MTIYSILQKSSSNLKFYQINITLFTLFSMSNVKNLNILSKKKVIVTINNFSSWAYNPER